MVHFDCPKCGKKLDVDSGFRGAVARCDSCGALISVPTKDAHGGGEAVKRPSRPPKPEEYADHGPGVVRKRAGTPVWVVVTIGVIALSLIVGGLWWSGALPGLGQTTQRTPVPSPAAGADATP